VVNECSAIKVSFTVVPYEKFDKLITLPYGIVTKSWPFPKFENPSKLGNSIEPLKELYNGLNNNSIGFSRLSEEEHAKWVADYEQGLKDGTVVVKPRKTRSDAGKKRGGQKRKKVQVPREDEEDEEGDGGEEDDDEEWGGITEEAGGAGGDESGEEDQEPPAKRLKENVPATTKAVPRTSKSTKKPASKSSALQTSKPRKSTKSNRAQKGPTEKDGTSGELSKDNPPGPAPSSLNDAASNEQPVNQDPSEDDVTSNDGGKALKTGRVPQRKRIFGEDWTGHNAQPTLPKPKPLGKAAEDRRARGAEE
jgi:hypothetical protein